jgi:hypothetical protein
MNAQSRDLTVVATSIADRLRPKEDTPEAIRNSILMADRMLQQAEADVFEARDAWISVQISGAAKLIEQRKAALKAVEERCTDIMAYKQALTAAFAACEERLRKAAIDERGKAANEMIAKANQAAAEFSEAWPGYAPAAAVIAAILEKERQAFELYNNARRLMGFAKDAGVASFDAALQHPTRSAIGTLEPPAFLFGDVVQLPGEYGAPFIFWDRQIEMVDEVQEYRDWDTPQSEWRPERRPDGTLGETRPPLKKRTVQRPKEYRAWASPEAQNDKPFWVHPLTAHTGKGRTDLPLTGS